jgi:hypothetical protein
MAKDKQLKLSMVRALPERARLVELETVDADGNPYVVQCEAFDNLVAAEIAGALPGASIQMGPKSELAPALDKVSRMLDVLRRFAERGTSLMGPDGVLIRPAFWFNDSVPRHELSLDGRTLPIGDVTRMGTVCMDLCGYGEGAASGNFRGHK